MGTEVVGRLEFGVLGPLEVRRDGELVALGGQRQRTLLALLLVHANRMVTVDSLVDELFGGSRSETAVNAVRVAVSRLRRSLENAPDGDQVVRTRPGGYVLRLDPERLDVARFERLLDEGLGLLASGQPAVAAVRLREALSLWRGPPLADLPPINSLLAESRRLDELRLFALMERIGADLAHGSPAELVPELESLVAVNPLQERLRGQLMVALYRCGRQADALEVYQRTRAHLVEELGLEPGRELKALQAQILSQDSELDPSATAPDVEAAIRTGPAPNTLLERDPEVTTLRDLVTRARAGAGSVAMVEGTAGIGKTSLLDASAGRAAELGMVVLRVQGDPLVVGSSFAAVRELLWKEAGRSGALNGAARLAAPVFEPDVWGEPNRDRAGAVLHGLYWLVAGLAERQPVLLVVDDAHWLDLASARFVAYLARRIESLPALLMVGLRGGEGSGGADLAATLADSGAEVLHPAALSEEASATVVRDELGPRAGDDLCQACHQATGGNPFYLRELTATLAHTRETLTEAASRVRSLGAAAIARSVLVRLTGLGPECPRLARAVAILGPGSALRHAASVAGLDRNDADLAADRLRSAGVLADGPSLTYVHPIVAEAVSAELADSRRAALHRDAARVLLDDAASSDRVAAHLLCTEPYGESWVVEAMGRAAREALARGTPDAAVTYLRRALAEPPASESRLDVMVELGRAELMLPSDGGFTTLREALDSTSTPGRRAEIACELAGALILTAQFGSACAVVESVLLEGDRPDAASVERLEAFLIAAGIHDLRRARSVLERAAPYLERGIGGELRDPLMLAGLAYVGAAAGHPARHMAALAREALRDPRARELGAIGLAAVALIWCDELEDAARVQEQSFTESRRRGSAPVFTWSMGCASAIATRAGDLDLAEESASRVLELTRELGPSSFVPLYDFGVFVERGRAGEALELLEPLERRHNLANEWQVLLAQRGIARIAIGQLERGLADLLDADRRMRAAGLQLGAVTDWVGAAVPALTVSGRREQAREIAERELAAAISFGAPRRHGIVLSLSGTLDAGEEGLGRLRDAVGILEGSPARLEHARALVNLGAGLRERGRRADAREPLSAALDIAHQLGAATLAERAHRELVAAGARPRRRARRGPDALTPAEMRTARMATDGLTNREIAQALFVSSRTVEAQLHQAYSKLEISSRGELARALAALDRRPTA
jgi:DNA-binding SARP family transcriptional activator/DNA-binding CsgD family transcriptional regulator